MTKEEILEEKLRTIPDYGGEDQYSTNQACAAMDEYAKQQGILFVEWLVEKSFRVNKGVWESPVSIGVLSTDELYDIFIKSKQ